jgi:MFS family permease
VASNLGDGIALVAYPWLASTVTRDGFLLGLVVFASRAPWLLFSLPAGAVIDRVDRRRLIVSADLVRCLLTAGVAVAVLVAGPDGVGTSRPGLVLTCLVLAAFLLGAAEVLRDSASQTILPSLVDKAALERANGRLWAGETVANSFVGPPLAGPLLAVAMALPFLVDAGTFAVAAGLVALIGGEIARPHRAGPRTTLRADVREGVAWLWAHPLFRPLALVLGVMNGLATMATATLVLYAQEVLSLDATGFGVLTTAGAAGAVLGALTAARVTARIGKPLSLFSCLWGSVVGYLAIGLTSSPVLVWAMFAMVAYVGTLWNVITVSLRQRVIPDHLLGRVNSVYRFFGWGMISVGALLGGALVSVLEPVAGRELALRLPFLVAGVGFGLTLLYALPRLGAEQIALTERDALRCAPESTGDR